jgi:hypothetical protein
MPHSNLERLIAAARLLQPVLEELVFVGGAVTGLLITDEAAAAPRSTLDVDAIVATATYAEYAAFGDRLRALGLAPRCGESGESAHRAGAIEGSRRLARVSRAGAVQCAAAAVLKADGGAAASERVSR